MASQDARLSKFEADFKQQQGEMTNKIDTFLKAINDRMTGALPSDTVKNPKLNVNSTFLVLSTRSYPMEDPQCSSYSLNSINAIKLNSSSPKCIHFINIITILSKEDEPRKTEIVKQDTKDNDHESIVKVEEKSKESEENDGDVMFVELIKKYDDSSEEELRVDENTVMEEELGYFDRFPTRSELAYHKEDPEGIRGTSNFTGRIRGMHIFIGNFTYVSDFLIVEDISSIIDHMLSQVVLGKPFVEVSNTTHDSSTGVVKFTIRDDEIAYKIPHKMEQYNSLPDLEKEHTKSVYLRNEEDKRRGVDYIMNKILEFYKECLELGPVYLAGLEDEGGVTLYLIRRSFGVLRSELEAWIFDVALESLHQFFMVMQLWDNYYFEFRKSTNAPDIFPARHILGGYSSPKRVHFINTITILSKEDELGETKIVKQDTKDNDHESIVKVEEKIPSSSNTQFVCTKENDEDVMFVELIKKYDDSSEEGLEVNENAVTEE
ncbi:hypothetical protein Tco_0577534 [Tanacetum coccineum]